VQPGIEKELKDMEKDDLLGDGERRTVPMMMRDSAGEPLLVTDAAEQAYERYRRRQMDAVAANRAAWLRLGRDGADAAERERAEQIYRDEKRRLSDAWRQDATPVGRGQQEGAACTVRAGGRDEGSPGHLRMVNGKLTCVPDQRRDAPRTMTADDAQPIRDAAYRQYCDELVNAWKAR
jgi:hypothetical protein